MIAELLFSEGVTARRVGDGNSRRRQAGRVLLIGTHKICQIVLIVNREIVKMRLLRKREADVLRQC